MKLKNTIPALFLILSACSEAPTEKPSKDENSTSVGGNKDDHGCYASAGFTWSEVQNDCVQLFDIADRLNPIDQKKDEAVISSFVILSSDKSKAELHINNKRVILPKTAEHIYEKDNFKYDYNDCSLYVDGKKTYQIEKH